MYDEVVISLMGVRFLPPMKSMCDDVAFQISIEIIEVDMIFVAHRVDVV